MRKKFNIIVMSSSEEEARKNVTEWFSHKKNFTVDSVTSYRNVGYQFWFSFEEKTDSQKPS